MGDWDLTDFNSRLIGDAFPKSRDYPHGKGQMPPGGPPSPPPPPAAQPPPPEPAPQAKFDRPGWYYGPKALRPESMGNLALYYLERPGAKLETPLKVLRGLVVVCGLVTGTLFLALISSNADTLMGPKNPPSARPSNLIGIVNPSWVEDKISRAANASDSAGYYDSAAGGLVSIQPPAKFIYVAPEVAQQYLEKLIRLGYVSATGATPNVVRDFKTLKGLGITVEGDGSDGLSL